MFHEDTPPSSPHTMNRRAVIVQNGSDLNVDIQDVFRFTASDKYTGIS